MLDGYHQQQQDQQHNDFLRTGTLVAAIYNNNPNRDPNKNRWLTASDFFPFLPKPEGGTGESWTMEAYTEDDEEGD